MPHKIKDNLKGKSKASRRSKMKIEGKQQKQYWINNKDIRR